MNRQASNPLECVQPEDETTITKYLVVELMLIDAS